MDIGKLWTKPRFIASAMVGVLTFIAVMWDNANDSCFAPVEDFLRTSSAVTSQLGPIISLQQRRSVSVDPSVNVNDEQEPGYKEYVYMVKGEMAKAIVSVKADPQTCSARIEAFEPY